MFGKKNYFFLFQPWPKNLKKPFPALAHVAALSSVVAVAFERWRTFLPRQRRRGERGGDDVASDCDDCDDGDDVALILAFTSGTKFWGVEKPKTTTQGTL